jgi:hypothetical protein
MDNAKKPPARAVKQLLLQKWPLAVPPGAAPGENLFRTGVPAFNQLLAGGGLPRGQWLEVQGAPGSGKTGFLFALLSGCTSDEVILYLDFPRQFCPAAARAAGLRLDQVRWSSPAGLQGALRLAETLLVQRQVSVVVLDLVGQKSALPPVLVHRLRQETLRRGALVFLLTEPSLHVVPPSTVALRAGLTRRGSTCIVSVLRSRIGPEGVCLVWSPVSG